MDERKSWIVIEFNEVRGQVYDLLADLKYVEFDPVLWDMLLYQLSEYGTQGIASTINALSVKSTRLRKDRIARLRSNKSINDKILQFEQRAEKAQ